MSRLRYSAPVLLGKYVNREPRLFGMLLGLLFGAMLSPFTLATVSQLPYLLAGVTVQGTVVGKQQAGLRPPDGPPLAMLSLFAHGKGRPRYVIRYEYTDADGKRHVGEGRASFTVWKQLRPGDPVAVRYLRSNPAMSRLESAAWDFWPAIPFAVLGPVIVVGSVWHGMGGFRWVNRQVRLVRHGQAVPGRITRAEVEVRGRRRKEKVCVLEYEYAVTDLVTGRLEMRGKPHPGWRTGGGLLILVDPIEPTDHAPDIFDARAEDADRLFGTQAEERGS